MRLILAALAVSALSPLAACAQDVPPPAPRPVMGGWAPATVTPEVEAAAVFAFAELDIPGAELLEIKHVTRQVVAGTNYRFEMVMMDGRRWRVTVWHKLDGSHVLTASEEIPAA